MAVRIRVTHGHAHARVRVAVRPFVKGWVCGRCIVCYRACAIYSICRKKKENEEGKKKEKGGVKTICCAAQVAEIAALCCMLVPHRKIVRESQCSELGFHPHIYSSSISLENEKKKYHIKLYKLASYKPCSSTYPLPSTDSSSYGCAWPPPIVATLDLSLTSFTLEAYCRRKCGESPEAVTIILPFTCALLSATAASNVLSRALPALSAILGAVIMLTATIAHTNAMAYRTSSYNYS